MGADIKKAFPNAKIELEPGGKGDFIVTMDGRKLWDKRAMGDEFPEPKQVLDKMKAQPK